MIDWIVETEDAACSADDMRKMAQWLVQVLPFRGNGARGREDDDAGYKSIEGDGAVDGTCLMYAYKVLHWQERPNNVH